MFARRGARVRWACVLCTMALCCPLLVIPWLSDPLQLLVHRPLRLVGPALRGSCLPHAQSTSDNRQLSTEVSIGVVSLHNAKDEMYQISHRNRQGYCEQHGYKLLDGTDWYKNSGDGLSRGLAYYSWIKVEYLYDVMRNYSDLQWIFWMDTDALFMNTEIRLSQLLLDVTENDVIVIAADAEGLNAGTFLIRNNELGRRFLRKWLEKHRVFLYEQQALSDMYNDAVRESGQDCHLTEEEDYKHPSGVKACIDRKAPGFHMLKLCAMGSWGGLEWKHGHGYYLEGFYMYGDFIVHFAGNDKPTKVRLMRLAEDNGL